MTRVLVVDDEALARARLVRLLEKLPGYELAGEAANGEQALAACARLCPDVVCLDIRMPGMDGLEVASVLAAQNQPPAVVFCTAYGDYALDAFAANAVDYLLKPVNLEKLDHALNKARRLSQAQIQDLQAGEQEAQAQAQACLTVRRRNGLHRIPLDQVRVLTADQKYVTVYHTDGEDLLDESLRQLEQRLGDGFLRVHRNALVALKHVQAMERDGLGRYHLKVADISYRPTVSRRLVGEVKDKLQG